jgi:hypothetical protein
MFHFNDLKKNYPLDLKDQKGKNFRDSLGHRTLIVYTDNSNKLDDFHFINNYLNILKNLRTENKGHLKFVTN